VLRKGMDSITGHPFPAHRSAHILARGLNQNRGVELSEITDEINEIQERILIARSDLRRLVGEDALACGGEPDAERIADRKAEIARLTQLHAEFMIAAPA
jgi:hypothetical protein